MIARRMGVWSVVLFGCGGTQNQDATTRPVPGSLRLRATVTQTTSGLQITLVESQRCYTGRRIGGSNSGGHYDLPQREQVPCLTRPVAGHTLWIRLRGKGERVERQLGTTDAHGRLSVAWATLAKQVPVGLGYGLLATRSQKSPVGMVDLRPLQRYRHGEQTR